MYLIRKSCFQIRNCSALINLHNIPHDVGCFVSSVASVLLHKECQQQGLDPLNASNSLYLQFYDSLSLENIGPVVDFNSMHNFVRQNRHLDIIIDVYCMFGGNIYPSFLGIGKRCYGGASNEEDALAETSNVHTDRRRVPLLSVELPQSTSGASLYCSPGQHLLGIRSMDSLLSRWYPKSTQRKYTYICTLCLDRFKTKELRKAHQERHCAARHGSQQVEEWPPPTFRYKFSSFHKQYLSPLIGTFDFEALLDDAEATSGITDNDALRPCAHSEKPCHRSKCVCDENADHPRPKGLLSVHIPVCFSFVMTDVRIYLIHWLHLTHFTHSSYIRQICGNVVDEYVEVIREPNKHAGTHTHYFSLFFMQVHTLWWTFKKHFFTMMMSQNVTYEP